MWAGGSSGGGDGSDSLSAEWRSVMDELHDESSMDMTTTVHGTPAPLGVSAAPGSPETKQLSPPAGVRTDMDRFMARYMEARTQGLDEDAAYEVAAEAAAEAAAADGTMLPIAVVPGLESLGAGGASPHQVRTLSLPHPFTIHSCMKSCPMDGWGTRASIRRAAAVVAAVEGQMRESQSGPLGTARTVRV